MNQSIPYFASSHQADEMQQYFNTLPKTVQETIVQSHKAVDTVEELKSLAEGLMGNS